VIEGRLIIDKQTEELKQGAALLNFGALIIVLELSIICFMRAMAASGVG
jgi:hypothetical protein